MFWSTSLIFAYVHLCVASLLSSQWNDLAEKHAWTELPRGWVYESPAPPDYSFLMRIGLKQHRIEDLIGSLMETSDPNHPRYVIACS